MYPMEPKYHIDIRCITELYNFWSSEFISSNKLSLAKNMRYLKYMIAPL